MLYLSQAIGRPVLDANGEPIGVVAGPGCRSSGCSQSCGAVGLVITLDVVLIGVSLLGVLGIEVG